MKIDYKVVNTILYIGVSGELDESTAVYVRNSLDDIIAIEGVRKVIIDLSELDFMDSTGIGILIGRYKKLKNNKIPVMVANPTKNVDKVLTLSGIYELMPKIDY